MRRTLSSIAASSTAPVAHRGDERVAPRPARPRHDEVERRAADAAVERVANQSDMTSPSKPHSPCRTSRSSGLSVIGSPLTPL